MRILEVGDTAYLQAIRPEQVDYFYVGKRSPIARPYLNLREFFRLRRKLRAGDYGLVVLSIYGMSGPAWKRDRGWLSNVVKLLRGVWKFYSWGPEIVGWMLAGIDVPLVVLDRKDDPDRIPAHLFPLLARCRTYFWRELPVKIENGFLFTTSYLEDTAAVRSFSIFVQHRHKIEPISLGVPWRDIYDQVQGQPKQYDVFFAGSVKGSRIRTDGLALLDQLRAEGLRVRVAADEPMAFDDYITACAQSWLVWSPEGHGWDCYRHYEICLTGAVPVMNFPRIRRYRPLVEGTHAFYYGVEGDDLKRVIRRALARGEAELQAMAARAREHVRHFHLEDKIFERVTGSLDRSA